MGPVQLGIGGIKGGISHKIVPFSEANPSVFAVQKDHTEALGKIFVFLSPAVDQFRQLTQSLNSENLNSDPNSNT